jgi:hypothetical protein
MNEKWLIALLPIVAGLLAIVPVIKADSVNVTATVPPYVSVVFNYNTVDYGQVNATGVTDLAAPNQNSGIYNVTVATNVPLNVSAYRSAWSPSGPLTLKFAVGSSVPTAPQVTLTTDSQVVATLTQTGQYTHYHGYWLTIPAYTAPGTYSTTVTITYAAA